ncbi:unnamed protein product [Candidula unifasciata]|uniref:Spondin domain-containing protein n=1 Tax=Candidula unifasciata TaxID=100452 RepID=A0A8S3ZD47_9EUPU|nr:unnamed protein product [Candidula unifasciata]
MWEEGANATLGAKLFAEQGDANQLDVESVQGYDDILDSFVAPPVSKGVGQTSTIVILDGHSSKLSFMMRIIPSPDWFIGVNSLDLCAHGRWKNKVHLDLTPFDAGTDQGLTFTAPNWPNTPQMPISAITSSLPDHPASSFFYPEFTNLPRLAYLELDIVSEYRHRETFMKVLHHFNATEKPESSDERKLKDNDVSTTTVKMDSKLSPFSVIFNKVAERASKNHNDNNPATEGISSHFEPPGHSNRSSIKNKEDNVITLNNSHLTTNHDNNDEINADGNKKEVHKSTTRKVDTERDPTFDTELKPALDSRFGAASIDCEVSEWSEWSECSQSCGFGQMERVRGVSVYPQSGGANCPRLTETSLCGSMRNCQWTPFTFLSPNATKRQMREGRNRRPRVQAQKLLETRH